MNSHETLEISLHDLIANIDGTVSIKSPDLHKLVSERKTPLLQINSPPYGQGEGGNPNPPPPKPIVQIIITF